MKFDCVFYYVSDLDRAVRFFSETLGLTLSSRDSVARFMVDGVLFELVPTTDPSRYSGSGNARVAFHVPDIQSVVHEFERKGVSVGPVQQVENGFLATFTDPDDNELCLWQYAHPAPMREDASRFEVLGQRLEYRWIGPRPDEAPTIVFLHEGLGCAGMWRDFPDRLASASGCGALVYSRMGYGASDPVSGPRPVRFMHDEALHVLPAVIERFGLGDVLLFGHSDGASIAIIYAGARRGPVRGLILEAPHVFVEPVCIESITRIAETYETTRLPERLARHHGANTDSMFRTWTDVWLRPEFRQWNIEEYLPAIESPVLLVQGEEDNYGTVRQVDAVLKQVKGPAESLLLARCGHSPHSDRPDDVLEAAGRFIRKTLDPGR